MQGGPNMVVFQVQNGPILREDKDLPRVNGRSNPIYFKGNKKKILILYELRYLLSFLRLVMIRYF
jgi:hypothetical protein